MSFSLRDLAVDFVLSCESSLGAFAFLTDSDREILDAFEGVTSSEHRFSGQICTIFMR